MVIAAGSVMNEPRIGVTVSSVNHQAAGVDPPRRAIARKSLSASARTGREAAIVMITTTKTASSKWTCVLRYPMVASHDTSHWRMITSGITQMPNTASTSPRKCTSRARTGRSPR